MTFPPIVPPWTGDPQAIVDYARQSLAMKLSDPNVAVLQRLVGSAMESTRDYLGWPSIPDEGQTVVPDVVRDACVNVLVELYRRRDLTFGVVTSADADAVTWRIAADWLAANAVNLHQVKHSWGMA